MPQRPRTRLVPRVKFWLEVDGEYVFGHGLAKILAAVDKAGSIKQAAVDLQLSYRYVWGRIKEAENALGQTLIEAHVGGAGSQRSFLTPHARKLLDGYNAVRDRLFALAKEEFAGRFS